MDHNILRWMCPPQFLTLDERISNVLIVLQDLGISPIDLLLVTLGPQNEYKAYKDSFYHGNSLAVDHLLNVVDAEKQGHDQLMRWVNVRALDIVLNRVSKEMDSLRVFRMSIQDLTPEFLMEFKLQSAVTQWERCHCFNIISIKSLRIVGSFVSMKESRWSELEG